MSNDQPGLMMTTAVAVAAAAVAAAVVAVVLKIIVVSHQKDLQARQVLVVEAVAVLAAQQVQAQEAPLEEEVHL